MILSVSLLQQLNIKNLLWKLWLGQRFVTVVWKVIHISVTERWPRIFTLRSVSKPNLCRLLKTQCLMCVLAWFDHDTLGQRHLKFHKANDIDYIPKKANPVSVPEDRPNETYWAFNTTELKKEPKSFENYEQLQYRWNRTSSRVSEETVVALMRKVREIVKTWSKLEPKT